MELSPEWLLTALASAVIGGIIGGGAIAGLAYRALKDRLIGDLVKIFAKRSELDGIGSRVNALSDVLATTRDRSDSNADAIIRLQEADRHRWEPVAAMLKRLDERLDSHEKAITRTVAVLDSLEKRMDRRSTHGRD